MNALTQQTLDLLKGANPGLLAKAGISQATGLQVYSLQAPAMMIYPVLTPLRNIIPRVGPRNGMAGTAEHWKIISAVNPTGVRANVSEGNRGAAISMQTTDMVKAYAGIGLENFVTFEADYAGEGFEDVKADAVLQNLQSLMIQEEQIILCGNATNPLGVTPTPTGVATNGGGSLGASTTNFLYCVALTYWGIQAASGGVLLNPVPSTGQLFPTVSKTNMDGSVDTFGGGVSRISAASTAITTTGSSFITAAVAPVKLAFGYAWFLGTVAGAQNAFLVAVTNLPNAVITAAATSTYAANNAALASDNSVNAMEFDGLLTQAGTLNGYYKSMNGTALTSDGAGNITEIDTMFKYFWDNFKTSPQTLWMDAQCIRDVTKHVAAGATNPSYRINLENTLASLGNLVAGSLVVTLVNKYAMNGAQTVDVRIHPNMPVGTIYADMTVNPYPNTKGGNSPRQIRYRRDYYQQEWPIRTRKYEYGCYADEFLQMFFGFGTGFITDIAAG